jgi:signal transduction histidine kinase
MREREESLLDFLQDAGIPLVARLESFLRAASLGLALASVAYGAASLALDGSNAWSADATWGGAIPSLCSAPLYAIAWRAAKKGELARSGFFLFAALLAFSILASWQRGALYPGWYVQPFLCLTASACLGIVPGLSLSLVSALSLAASPFGGGEPIAPGVESEIWLHSISLMALSLASALTGVLLHKVLVAALQAGARHRMEKLETARALRHSEKLLRHALRVDTVGDLAGLVSHQLRNAFQVMLGHVTLHALGGDDQPGERLRLVGETLMQSRPLLDQLMQLAHPDDGAVEDSDLAKWLHDFAERARRVMPATIEVRCEPCATPLPVRLELRGLDHAMWNLAINARHAMEQGGVLTFAAEQRDGMACIVVRDTGTGIPAELQQKIFDPYVTTKPIGQGTGLGLTAVARYVLSCEGRIEVQSEPGKGAEFTLRFPLAVAPSDRGAQAEIA